MVAARCVTTFFGTAFRISRRDQSNRGGVWVTERTIMRRLASRISLEELVPKPGFESGHQRGSGEASDVRLISSSLLSVSPIASGLGESS